MIFNNFGDTLHTVFIYFRPFSAISRLSKPSAHCERRGYDMELLREAIRILSTEGKLPEKYLPHQLHGDRKGQWECHIQPNWLLIWEIRNQELVLVLLNTGTHSDLFGKKYKKR